MTIHSDWSRILHDECAEAFVKKAPKCKLDIGIIDGHLQLMRLDARMGTWECFIRNQFIKPIQILFSLGCPRVVLCFDNYGAVPAYKSMTQISRCNKHGPPVKVFGAHDSLPSSIPDEPMVYLMNRNFKVKLIEMLCERIPLLVDIQAGHEFILDYKIVVSYTEAKCRIPVVMKDMESMGESDVKFCRYVSKYGNALVHAIDGDYMAISLLYYTQHKIQENNKIFIYRQLSVLHSTSSTVTAKNKRKRLLKQEEEEAEEALTFFNASAPLLSSSQQPKCWVNMQMVYTVIAQVMRQCRYNECMNPKTQQPYTDQDAVFSAVYLMLCAGTDFSRNIPLLGPKRMWEALPLISSPLIQAVRGDSIMNEKMFLNLVIGRIYALNYNKHVNKAAVPFTLKGVLDSLHVSRLSDGTKSKLPTIERMLMTLRNLNWVIQYWSMENGLVETPLDGTYGYANDSVTGNTTFADLLSIQPSPLQGAGVPTRHCASS